MRQIIQDLKNGATILEEVPAPLVKPSQVLIQSTCSIVEFGKSNLFQ